MCRHSWTASWGAGLAPATIDGTITPLKALYRRAVARGEVQMNPCIGIEKPAVRTATKRVVSLEVAQAMLAALDREDRVLWATAFFAGLRRGELTGLMREDIDLATGIIHVRRGWDRVEGAIDPKSRRGHRKVPIAAILRDHLDQHLLDLPHGRVFGSPSWIVESNNRARKCWEGVGLPVLTLHEARHVYASFGIAAGLNAKALSTFMGHANIQTTYNLYGHLLPGSEDEAVGLLDAYFTPTVAQTVAQPQEMAV